MIKLLVSIYRSSKYWSTSLSLSTKPILKNKSIFLYQTNKESQSYKFCPATSIGSSTNYPRTIKMSKYVIFLIAQAIFLNEVSYDTIFILLNFCLYNFYLDSRLLSSTSCSGLWSSYCSCFKLPSTPSTLCSTSSTSLRSSCCTSSWLCPTSINFADAIACCTNFTSTKITSVVEETSPT